LHVCNAADLVTALVLVALRCRTPVGALAVLKTQDAAISSNSRPKMQTRTDLTWIDIKVDDLPSWRDCTPQVPWGTPCCGSARRRCSSRDPSSSHWRTCAMRPEYGRIAPSI
jgi:hypothetical protein